MLYIMMNVNDSAIRLLTQNLQTFCMKDIPGENVGVIVSYLKEVLLLLQNVNKIPTDVMRLLNNTFCSTACENFTDFMKNVYFSYKRKTQVIDPMKFLSLVESE